VSNDRGHLLPGVPKSKESPWGKFKGTWDEGMDCRNTKHCDNLVISKCKQASVLKSYKAANNNQMKTENSNKEATLQME